MLQRSNLGGIRVKRPSEKVGLVREGNGLSGIALQRSIAGLSWSTCSAKAMRQEGANARQPCGGGRCGWSRVGTVRL